MAAADVGDCVMCDDGDGEPALEKDQAPPSVVDRYCKRSYVCDLTEAGKNNDICVLTHSNRICIVTLSKNHSILQEKKTVKAIDFQIPDGVNRLDNQVSGKLKKGGQWLKPKSLLCRVVCEDGDEFSLRSGVAGKLVEVNERLVSSPDLLTSKPETEGFIAIVMPELPDAKKRSRNWYKKKH